MSTYTSEELIQTQLKSVSVSVSLGEMNSEDKKKVRVGFFCCKGTANDTSFFRSGSREGLSELVMGFPAELRAFLKHVTKSDKAMVYVITTPADCRGANFGL